MLKNDTCIKNSIMRSLTAVCLNIIFTIFKDYYLLGQIMNDFMMRLLNRIFGICQFEDLFSNIWKIEKFSNL